VLAIIIIPSILSEMLTDWMWFASQNLADVYTTRLWLALGVFFGAGILAVLALYFNWMIAWRASRPSTVYPGQAEPLPRNLVRWITLGAALLVGLILALAASSDWPTILLYLHGGTFGQTDPLFHNDIGFYVFSLPFYKLIRGWLVVLVVLAAIGSIIIYVIAYLPQISRQVTDFQTRGPAAARQNIRVELGGPIGLHLTILGAIFLTLIGVSYYFDRFDLLYSSRAVAYGAGYSDVNAKWPALNILIAITGIMVILLLVNIRVRTWRLLVGALGVWLVAFVVVGNIYPAIIQQFVVKPSESQLEKPFIVNNIQATRQAFSLDKFTEQDAPAVTSTTPQQIDANTNIVNNIRLWDYRPLLDTYKQLQGIRPYYTFADVDIDRYTISDTLKQVMLSARELSVENAAQSNPSLITWENEHIRYTHGYGTTVSPVNVIQGEGLPDFLVKDIPPATNLPELKITRPEIYFGEDTNDYVFVDSSAVKEFDYPTTEGDQFTNYAGHGGVDVSNFLTKLLFAVRFGDGNVILSPYLTPGTKVLFHRTVQDAAQMLAPFLKYDHDPYIVISGGKLYWILDAYTYTDRYPYSTPYSVDEFNSLNYIRNSVKVVMDAYNGDMTFYVVDPTDPLVNAYRGIFPDLFKDVSQMPPDLKAHWRYPEDLLNIQANMYTTFHMTDPQVFYTKEDQWAIPSGGSDQNVVQPQAYYVNMQIPGDTKEGFMLIQPFTPNNRDNMIAWMAAKSDGSDYGKVVVERYPKQGLVYGPNQIYARINQNAIISQQLTLWSQSGSSVLHGNLITVPISDSVIYVEPLFLQATSGNSIPELKRVIVATSDNVGIGSDLNEALDVAFGLKPAQIIGASGGSTAPSTTPVPGTIPSPAATSPPLPTIAGAGSAADLARSALDHYNRAQQALQNGDWTTYGNEQNAMKSDLQRLQALIGTPTPSP
jgi:uncharacterized membrane protein (UPF0182 family)